MKKRSACRLESLFEGAVVRTNRCPDCGQVHIHIGGVTLRFSDETFVALVMDLEAARRRLTAERSWTKTPEIRA